MPKIVYNRSYGGFGLSRKAILRIRELKNDPKWQYGSIKGDGDTPRDYGCISEKFPRHDPDLVQVVEELGDEANGDCAELELTEVAPGTVYKISNYDGKERVEIIAYIGSDVWVAY